MIVADLLDRIQSLYSKGVSSDESRLSSRHIYSKLLTVRQQLIAQQIRKRQKISDWNYVILPCVELIKVPNHECSCLDNLGCDVYRTKFPLPKVLTDLNKHMIDFVMSVENGIKIEETSRQGVNYLKGNKYTGTKPKYLFENGFLYFPIQKSPGIVKIKLLPEDPIKAQQYPSFCEDCEDCVDCKSFDQYEFYIDGDLIEPLITMAVTELIEWFNKGVEDRTNNSADTDREQGK